FGETAHGLVQPGAAGLEQHRAFARLAAFAFPAIDRADAWEDVGAGDQSRLEQRIGGPRRLLLIGEGTPDQRSTTLSRTVHRLRPIACTPQAVAATSRAPTSWCRTASHSATPVITVAIPSRTWMPSAEWIATEAGRTPAR